MGVGSQGDELSAKLAIELEDGAGRVGHWERLAEPGTVDFERDLPLDHALENSPEEAIPAAEVKLGQVMDSVALDQVKVADYIKEARADCGQDVLKIVLINFIRLVLGKSLSSLHLLGDSALAPENQMDSAGHAIPAFAFHIIRDFFLQRGEVGDLHALPND